MGPYNGAEGAFMLARINSVTDPNTFQIVNFTNRDQFTKYLTPPIQFCKIRVQFKTLYGTYYNFYGLDNYITLEIKQLTGQKIISSINQVQ